MNKFTQILVSLFLAFSVFLSSLIQPINVSAGGNPGGVRVFCNVTGALDTIIDVFSLDFLNDDDGEGPWYNPTLCSFTEKVFGTPAVPVPDDQLFGERYTYAQVNWITSSLLLQTSSWFEKPAEELYELFTQKEQPKFKDFISFGPMGIFVGSISDMLSTPPASGVDSVRSTLAKFDPATSVHAQVGYGYESTEFLRPLWTASRNMAYGIMVILLIASGFMIMFRVKLNPQTAVSLQLMIPRIIINLLLVTFSYAIAGLIIDLLFVFMSVFIALLASPSIALSDNAGLSIRFFLEPGFGKIFLYYASIWNTVGWGIFIPIVGPLIGLVMSLVIVFLIFRVWWMMLKTYLTLMFLIIIGPWQIMLDILPIPGQTQTGFSSWLRNVIANTSVFAVVPIMFILNMVFWDQNGIVAVVLNSIFGNPGDLYNIFIQQPHIISPTSRGALPGLPLFGSEGFFFNFALGYAILSLIPKTSEMVRDALKAPKFQYGTAFGEAITQPFRTTGNVISHPVTGAVVAPPLAAITNLDTEDIKKRMRSIGSGFTWGSRQIPK